MDPTYASSTSSLHGRFANYKLYLLTVTYVISAPPLSVFKKSLKHICFASHFVYIFGLVVGRLTVTCL